MSNLTIEECIACLNYDLGVMSPTVRKCFEQLIYEHFDNPPLKFEELEEGMWVWDNSVYEKNYALIKRKFICANDLVVEMRDDECEDGDEYLGRVFEENRFYAKEVKYNDNIYK